PPVLVRLRMPARPDREPVDWPGRLRKPSARHGRACEAPRPRDSRSSRRYECGPSRLGFLVFLDGPSDLLPVLFVVIPGGVKVGLRQRRLIALEQFLVAHTESARLHQHPDGNTSIANTGSATDDIGRFLNPAWRRLSCLWTSRQGWGVEGIFLGH